MRKNLWPKFLSRPSVRIPSFFLNLCTLIQRITGTTTDFLSIVYWLRSNPKPIGFGHHPGTFLFFHSHVQFFSLSIILVIQLLTLLFRRRRIHGLRTCGINKGRGIEKILWFSKIIIDKKQQIKNSCHYSFVRCWKSNQDDIGNSILPPTLPL